MPSGLSPETPAIIAPSPRGRGVVEDGLHERAARAPPPGRVGGEEDRVFGGAGITLAGAELEMTGKADDAGRRPWRQGRRGGAAMRSVSSASDFSTGLKVTVVSRM